MDTNQVNQESSGLERHGDIFKLDTPSPTYKEDDKEKKSSQAMQAKSFISDIASEIYENPEVALPVGGALYGYGTKKDFLQNQKYLKQRQFDLQAMQDLARKAAIEAEAAKAALSGNAPQQTAFERQIQGAREPNLGTTGRAREVAFNTETARQAQVRQGVVNPFTQGIHGATDQGILIPQGQAEKLAAEKALENAQKVRSMANRKALIEAAKGPLSTVLDWAAKSKLLGALSGASGALEGYDAYKAFREGRPLEGVMSGISSVGGALGTIPHPGAQLAGGALSIAPTVGRKFSEYTYNVFGNPKVQD